MTDYKNLLTEAIDRFRGRHRTTAKFRAALVDMDGTLYNSMVNHTAAWHRMMTELGINEPRDSYYLFEGMTGRQTINTLFNKYLNREASPEEIEEYYRRKTVYFTQLPAVDPMPGAASLLSGLKAANWQCVLVTGSGQRTLIDRLQRDFPGVFDEDKMITSRDVARGKPHPEPYLKAMQLAQVAPSEAVVIENAPLGVEAGAKSGAFTIGLTTGPIPADALASAGADIVLPSMQALADLSLTLRTY